MDLIPAPATVTWPQTVCPGAGAELLPLGPISRCPGRTGGTFPSRAWVLLTWGNVDHPLSTKEHLWALVTIRFPGGTQGQRSRALDSSWCQPGDTGRGDWQQEEKNSQEEALSDPQSQISHCSTTGAKAQRKQATDPLSHSRIADLRPQQASVLPRSPALHRVFYGYVCASV